MLALKVRETEFWPVMDESMCSSFKINLQKKIQDKESMACIIGVWADKKNHIQQVSLFPKREQSTKIKSCLRFKRLGFFIKTP
jgi:hypothetical protein